MNKKIFALILFVSLFQQIYSQNLKFGDGEKNTDKGFARVDQSIGVLNNKYLLWENSFRDVTVINKRKVSYNPYIRVYDLDKMSSSRLLDLSKIISESDKNAKNILVTSVFLWKGKVVITYTQKGNDMADSHSYALLLNDNFQAAKSPVKLYEGIGKSQGFLTKNDFFRNDYFDEIDLNLFSFAFSKDSSKLVTFFTPRKDSTKELSFRIFDSNLNLLNEIKTEIPFEGISAEILKYKISEDGTIYLLLKSLLKEKKTNSSEESDVTKTELFAITKTSIKKLAINLNNNYVIGIANIEFQKNQFINCFGTYKEEKGKSISGLFSMKINLADFKVTTQSKISLLNDIVPNCKVDNKENDITLKSETELKDTWSDEAGNIFFTARDLGTERRRFYVVNSGSSSTFYENYKIQGDVVLFKIKDDSEINVISCFDNFSESGSGINITAGVGIFETGKNLHSLQWKSSHIKKDSKTWLVYKSFDLAGLKQVEKIIELPEKYKNHGMMQHTLSIISDNKIAVVLVNEKKVFEINVLNIELQ